MNDDIVFHFDHDPRALDIALSNIRNYVAFFPDTKPAVVLVVNGPGVLLLVRDGEYAEQIHAVSELGVSVRVCNNALTHYKILSERLCPECVVVPAGVVEIVRLQGKGFAYVKP